MQFIWVDFNKSLYFQLLKKIKYYKYYIFTYMINEYFA